MEIKKRKRKLILIKVIAILMLVLIALVGIPLLINIAFKIDAPASFLIAEWTAGDLLNFYGAIMVFIGTACLSVLALYQNSVFKKQNNQLIRVQNSSFINLKFSGSQKTSVNEMEKKCNFIVKEVSDERGEIITFDVENKSAFMIVSIKLQLQLFDGINNRWVNIVDNSKYYKAKSIVISPEDKYKLSFGIGDKTWEMMRMYTFQKNTLGLHLTFKNSNNLETNGRIICKKDIHKTEYKYILIPIDYDFETE